jgi:hypothetical protein
LPFPAFQARANSYLQHDLLVPGEPFTHPLCPISYILTRAIRDDAILVDGYTSAEPFFATDLGGQRMRAMKVHWKPEWLKQPVFRRSVRTVNG